MELERGRDIVVTCGVETYKNPFYFFLRQGEQEAVTINPVKAIEEVMGEQAPGGRYMESVLDGIYACGFRIIQLVNGRRREYKPNPHNADPIYFLYGLALAIGCWNQLAGELADLMEEDEDAAWKALEFTASFHQENPHRNRFIRLRQPGEDDEAREYEARAA